MRATGGLGNGESCLWNVAGRKLWILHTDLNATDLHLEQLRASSPLGVTLQQRKLVIIGDSEQV